jgi:hypothetical protein
MSAQPLFFVRLLAFAGLGFHTVTLLANVLQSWDTFNPSYWTYYLQQQLARPLIGLGISAVILLTARPLSRWLSRP